MIWPNSSGRPADLTGYEVEIYDASSALDGIMGAEITDAEDGEITVTLTWSEALSIGEVGTFRVRVTSPVGLRTSTSPFSVTVK